MMTPRSNSGVTGDTLYTHLNTTADQQNTVSGWYGGVTFVFGLSYQVSDTLIKVLQDFFQATTMGRDFNTHLNKVNKEVVIMDQFAPDMRPIPQIVVSSLPMDTVPLSLGNRLGQDTYNNEIYDVYGGQVRMAATLEIYDSGKPNVHQLADVVFLAMMQYVPFRLGALQMIVDIANVKFTNATRITGTNVGGEIYAIKMTFPIISEWRQYMEILTVDSDVIRAESTKPESSLK